MPRMEPATLIWIVILTLLPALEVRASIPYGILSGAPPLAVFLLAAATNIVLGLLVYFTVRWTIGWLMRLSWFDRLWSRFVVPRQERIHPQVERYGPLALALFIGIPLPGSGVWSGALVAVALGMGRRHFLLACTLGVLIASLAVTFLVMTGRMGADAVGLIPPPQG